MEDPAVDDKADAATSAPESPMMSATEDMPADMPASMTAASSEPPATTDTCSAGVSKHMGIMNMTKPTGSMGMAPTGMEESGSSGTSSSDYTGEAISQTMSAKGKWASVVLGLAVLVAASF